jgi:hypothetical protein
MRLQLSFAVTATSLLMACGGGSAMGPSPVPTPSPTVAPPAASARYRVTFETAWSSATHPTDFPAGAHFSPLIGATHSTAVRFWQPQAIASDGIEAMAEQGRTSPLDTEVEAAIAAGTARRVLRGPGVATLPGAAAIEFEIEADQPLVTLVTMIAPSPDWFAGVHDLSLLERSAWVEDKTVDLFPYDAGTDLGVTYTSADRDARPREPIQAITGSPLDRNGSVAPVGRFVFRRLP